MRKIIIAATIAASVLPVAAASAQRGYGYNDRVRAEQRECQRELRRADNRREYRRELAECRREIAQARRHGSGYGYNNHYRGQRYWDGHRWRYR